MLPHNPEFVIFFMICTGILIMLWGSRFLVSSYQRSANYQAYLEDRYSLYDFIRERQKKRPQNTRKPGIFRLVVGFVIMLAGYALFLKGYLSIPYLDEFLWDTPLFYFIWATFFFVFGLPELFGTGKFKSFSDLFSRFL